MVPLLPARRYASAGTLAVALCLSVTSRNSIETAERIELGFGTGGLLHPSYSTLKAKFGYLQKLGYFPLQLCPELRTWKILLSLPQPFLFLLQDSLSGFPRLFTVTFEHIRLFTF